MPFRLLIAFLALLTIAVAPARATAPGNRPTPGYVRVELTTSVGKIVVALDTRNAPRTSANFLTYVDDGRFDGVSFYRAARSRKAPEYGYIQGGIRTEVQRALPPVVHEPTNVTGIRHLDATISMARGGAPGSAMGNFFITVGATPFMDANGDYPGYAAFGHVVAGMDVVKRILALPTSGGVGAMKGQMIDRPVTILHARRLDGKPKPSGRAKAWLLWQK